MGAKFDEIDAHVTFVKELCSVDSLLAPGCGPKAAYAVAKLFGKTPPSLDSLTVELRQEETHGEVAFEDIRKSLVGQGMLCYPLDISVPELDACFESFVAVSHLERDPFGGGDHGHFLVLMKQNGILQIVDPSSNRIEVHDKNIPLVEWAENFSLTNSSSMIVSDYPIDIDSGTTNAVGASFIVIGVSVFLFTLLRKFWRRSPKVTAGDGATV